LIAISKFPDGDKASVETFLFDSACRVLELLLQKYPLKLVTLHLKWCYMNWQLQFINFTAVLLRDKLLQAFRYVINWQHSGCMDTFCL